MCIERCCFRAIGGFCQHYSALVFVAAGCGLAIFGFILVEISFPLLQCSWEVCLLVGNFWLMKGRLQTKFLEWLSGASSRQSNRKNCQPFCSLIRLAIFVATVNVCVPEFSIANSCLPQNLQSCVISAGSTNIVFFVLCQTCQETLASAMLGNLHRFCVLIGGLCFMDWAPPNRHQTLHFGPKRNDAILMDSWLTGGTKKINHKAMQV